MSRGRERRTDTLPRVTLLHHSFYTGTQMKGSSHSIINTACLGGSTTVCMPKQGVLIAEEGLCLSWTGQRQYSKRGNLILAPWQVIITNTPPISRRDFCQDALWMKTETSSRCDLMKSCLYAVKYQLGGRTVTPRGGKSWTDETFGYKYAQCRRENRNFGDDNPPHRQAWHAWHLYWKASR